MILEKGVHGQVRAYFGKCGALSQSQYGFRKGRSCSDLLLTTVDDWYLAQDAKKFTVVVFLDLSKAFDNVRHDLLLLALQSSGFGGTVLEEFFNYLNGRQQRIAVPHHASPPFLCTKGVPQGSVLGHLLFNLYLADLAKLAHQCGAALPSFADDLTLYVSHHSPEVACRQISNALSTIDTALASCRLQINLQKTVAMLIQPPARSRLTHQRASNFKIFLQSQELKFVEKTGLLGIKMDNRLSWSAQVASVCSKVGRKIGALKAGPPLEAILVIFGRRALIFFV